MAYATVGRPLQLYHGGGKWPRDILGQRVT